MPALTSDVLVGLIALALVPLIALRIGRGLRDRRLPVYRSYLSKTERPGAYNALLLVHVLSLVLIAIIAADLLLNLGLRDRI